MARYGKPLSILTALALVLTGPAALAAWLARPVAPVVSLPPAVVLGVAGQVPPGATEGPVRSPRMATLFGRGEVTVDRGGQRLELGREAYAYPGGERIVVGEGALAVMRLPGAGSVFLCGGSAATLNRTQDGQLSLDIDAGGARLVFGPGPVPGIDANGTVIGRSEGSDPDSPFAAEVLLNGDRLLVLPIEAPMNSETPVSTAEGEPWEGAPEARALWRLAEGGARPLELPGGLEPRSFLDDAPPDATGGGDYLCQIEDLAAAAELPDSTAPDTAPESREVALPGSEQLLDVPPGQDLALAEPGAEDSFDPNLLPAPAAGPASDDELEVEIDTQQLIVSLPSLPSVSTGGAGLASPD